MTDVPPASPPQGGGDSQPAPQGATLTIAGQYIKDLSFENPAAPSSDLSGKPQIQVGVDVQARAIGPEQYEVALKVHVNAKSGEAQVYLVELLYGGLFVIRNLPQENLQPLLLIECPRLLFPFARRIIADVTRDGGFMPLMLDPIDFASLFRQQALARAQQTMPNT